MSQITEKTLLPLSLVVVVLGGSYWFTNLYFTTQANAASIVKLEQKSDVKQDQDDKFQRQVLERLARIEEKISKVK